MTGDGWAALGVVDPVPGDPMAVSALARTYARAAGEVHDLLPGGAGSLLGGADGWSGSAADRFDERVQALSTDLTALARRLQGMAAALAAFAVALATAQRQARTALALAQQASRAESQRTAAAASAASAATAATSPAGSSRWGGPLAPYLNGPGLQTPAADPELARAARLLAAAVAERDRAAERCARAVAAATHDELRDPGRWRRRLRMVSRWSARLTSSLGIAALALCWVPGLGEVLAGAALVTGALALLADSARWAGGDQVSAGTFVEDIVGLLPVGKAARLGSALSRAETMGRAVREVRAARAAGPAAPLARRAPGAYWRTAPSLARTRGRFALSRGWHGLVGSATTHATVRAGGQDLAASIRSGIGQRSVGAFLHSPGGLVEELGRAGGQGPAGVAWLTAGYAYDGAQAQPVSNPAAG